MRPFTGKFKRSLFAFAALAAAAVFTSSCNGEMGGGGSGPKTWLEAIKVGQTAQASGDGAAAIENYERAAHLAEKQYGPVSPQVGTCLGYLCELYRDGQDWLKARDAYKRLLAIKMKYEPKTDDTKQFKAEYDLVQQKVRDYHLDPAADAAAAKAKAKGPAKKGRHHK